MCAGGLRKNPPLCEVLTKPLSRCGERSHQEDREDALEYADTRSEGSYHSPKVTQENAIPLPIPEPTLPAEDQSCLPLGARAPIISGHMLNTLRIQSIGDCQGHSTHDAPSEQKTRESS